MNRRSLALATALMIAACGGASKAALPDIDALRCNGVNAVAPESTSLPALVALGRREQAPLSGRIVHAGHGRAGAEPEIDVAGDERTALARELSAAARTACSLRTEADAERAGYRYASAYTQGVGTHWINWRLVDAPFDPTKPSMLLYGPRNGHTQLVGFSYWLRALQTDPPVGFRGNADHWHRHYGLCFDGHGKLEREDVQRSNDCAGTWLNGADLWMLHAWVVPGASNVWGLFAPMNPQLCDRNAPDIARCPGIG